MGGFVGEADGDCWGGGLRVRDVVVFGLWGCGRRSVLMPPFGNEKICEKLKMFAFILLLRSF